MKEIKFRGKRVDNGEWVYGSLIKDQGYGLGEDIYLIHNIDRGHVYRHEVDPATVGQFTGLKDKEGKEIYEGDMIKCHYSKYPHTSKCSRYHGCDCRKVDKVTISVIEWFQSMCNHGYRLNDKRGATLMLTASKLHTMKAEIIGNIHDNPLRLRK